jgi:RNA polymerase sigma-70 factor (ECF subfamily)
MAEKYNIDRLIEEYGKKVFNLALRITGDRQDAEDVTQETFLQVYRKLDTFQGKSHIYTWIYKIALNNSLQLKRRLTRAYMGSLDEKIELFSEEIPNEVKAWETDPEKRYFFDELTEEIRNQCYFFMTFRLTDEQRVAYILKNIMGLPIKTIAKVLDVEENVVKSRLHRAKNNLIDYFRNNCGCVNEDNKCSCRSRIGFALAYAPQILDQVRTRAYDRRTKQMIKDTVKGIPDIDLVYKSLPMHEYNNASLIEVIKK